MAAPNLTDLVVSTARKFVDGLQDNVSNHNGLFRHLKKKGKINKYSGGGRTVVEPFIHGSNASVQWYDGYDTFSPPTSFAVLDGSEWNWKQLGACITISGREKHLNRGPEQRIEFAKVRLQQVQSQLQNTFATAMYSDGTGSGSKELGGLQLIVADNPAAAGTVGGINQVLHTFWRNKFSASAATTSANVTSRFNAMYLQILRGEDKPDLIAVDNDFYTYYEESLQGLQRIMSSGDGADAGYGSLKYKGIPVVYDDACPDKRAYFINSSDLTLRVMNDRMFDVGDARMVPNADYEVIPVFTMATLTTGRRASHGVIIAA